MLQNDLEMNEVPQDTGSVDSDDSVAQAAASTSATKDSGESSPRTLNDYSVEEQDQLAQENPDEFLRLATEADDLARAENENTNAGEAPTVPKDTDAAAPEETDTTVPDSQETAQEETDSSAPLTAEQFRDALTAPFRANGKDVKISSPEEAIRLMQMGIGYSDRMRELKQQTNIIERLKDGGLLEGNTLDYAIDLINKKPDAIRKLVQDANLVNEDLNQDVSEYTPDNHARSDTEYAIRNVLRRIEDSPEYEGTLRTVKQDWDDASRDVISQEPEIIQTLCEHRENGVFKAVSDRMSTDEALGRFDSKLSMLDRYRATAETMVNEGILRPAGGQGTQASGSQHEAPKTVRKTPVTKGNRARATGLAGQVPKGNKQPRGIETYTADELSRVSPEQQDKMIESWLNQH